MSYKLAETKEKLKKVFMNTALYGNPYNFFSDLIFFMAASLKNSLSKVISNSFSQNIEDKYLRRFNKYNKKDQDKFCELFGLVVIIADQKKFPADNLGESLWK